MLRTTLIGLNKSGSVLNNKKVVLYLILKIHQASLTW